MKTLLIGLLALGSISAFANCELFEFSKKNPMLNDVEICVDVQHVEGGVELSNFSENINTVAHANGPFGQLYYEFLENKRVAKYLCTKFLQMSARDVVVKTTRDSFDQVTVVGKFAGYRWGNPTKPKTPSVKLKTIESVICIN